MIQVTERRFGDILVRFLGFQPSEEEILTVRSGILPMLVRHWEQYPDNAPSAADLVGRGFRCHSIISLRNLTITRIETF